MRTILETVVFFGSGPVAAKSLGFATEHFQIEAVVTKATPAHHKEPAPVEIVANKLGLPLLFANNKSELDLLILKERFKSSFGIIVDYGVIVSQATIDAFDKGIINSHFSLLPRWRGADPISFAILAGDKKTGVSLMLIEPTLDTGKIVVQRNLVIEPHDTTPVLTDKLIALSNEMLARHIPLYLSGDLKPRSQPHPERATYSRKLTKADGTIDWQKPASQIEREIRAFQGWPKSRTVLLNKELIITTAHVSDEQGAPGKVVVQDKRLLVYCGDGALIIDRLKPAGKAEMAVEAFLLGLR